MWLPCSVELSEGEQIYDRFSWLSANFESAVQASPEHNVLWNGQGRRNVIRMANVGKS